MSNRKFYLDLAERGLRMPIGTDLALHEEQDPEKTRLDGVALGRVIERNAHHWKTPLAFPLMDLRLEKIDFLNLIGVKEDDADKFHFKEALDNGDLDLLCDATTRTLCAGSQARNQALAYVANNTDLAPIGMTIGPFSLATRLMSDPVAASGLDGSGVSTEEDREVLLLHQCLQIAEAAVLRSIRGQVACGAKAVMICEPAASTAFISPRQIKAGSDIFERLVMQPNLRLQSHLEQVGVDLIFHDCGELTLPMVKAFARRLRPVVLSLGSSRRLWEDAAVVSKDVVLYGNLPSKSFYSEAAMPTEKVEQLTEDLVRKMRDCRHPHIIGTECDVLFVPEAIEAIRQKVEAVVKVRLSGPESDATDASLAPV